MTDGYQLQWITSHEVRTDEQVFSYTLDFQGHGNMFGVALLTSEGILQSKLNTR